MYEETHCHSQGYLRTTDVAATVEQALLCPSLAATSFNSCVLGWLSDWHQQFIN